MRIGFFTATYYPTPDGVSHYLRDVKSELERRGHEVHVFSFNGDSSERNVHLLRSVPFPAYPQYSMPINPFPVGLFRKAIKLNLEIIHIHDPFMGSLGYRVSRLTNVPVVATYHTDFVNMRDSLRMPLRDTLLGITWRYSLFLYRKCDEVFAPSIKSMSQLVEDGVMHAKELPLFVDTEKFKPGKHQAEAFKVQYIGRITKDKGVYRILDIAELLLDEPAIYFIISGTGPETEGLIKEIEKRGLGNHVEVTGYVDEPRKIQLLRDASLFLYPSDTDTFGISVLEALSSGVPAIVPNGFPLAHYDNLPASGLIEMDFSSPDAIASMISDMQQGSVDMAEAGRAARQFVLENFSKNTHCDVLEETYRMLLQSRCPSTVQGR